MHEIRIPIRNPICGLLLAVAVLSPAARAQSIAGFPQVEPEAVGFSSQRLQRVDAALQRFIDEKQIAGFVTVAARHGKVFQSKSYGLRDIETKVPMTQDTIFRIYSMTKVVTGVAMMILYEEGKWNPLDPVSKHIPEFANLKVLKGFDAAGKPQLEDPEHPPTMRELMTQTAGFGYGVHNNEPVDKFFKDENGRHSIYGAPSPQAMIDRLARIPLAYQPGTRWLYSVSADIQGYIVEKLSGKPLAAFMQERIFQPLGMQDTGFEVPQEKRNRLATLYRLEKGAFVAYKPFLEQFPMGGSGLFSTAGDYLKFAQMLLNDGELGRVRILGPQTVKMMTASHLPKSLPSDPRGPREGMRPGHGFGYDVGVYTEPALVDNVVGEGSYYWGGIAGTWFWADPANDLVFIGMVQNINSFPGTSEFKQVTQQTLYQALLDSRK